MCSLSLSLSLFLSLFSSFLSLSHCDTHTHIYMQVQNGCKCTTFKLLSAHWLMFAGNSIESNNIGVLKLGHESCFLKELHFVLGTSFVQRLQSNFNVFLSFLPRPSLNSTKTTSSKVTCHSKHMHAIQILNEERFYCYAKNLHASKLKQREQGDKVSNIGLATWQGLGENDQSNKIIASIFSLSNCLDVKLLHEIANYPRG